MQQSYQDGMCLSNQEKSKYFIECLIDNKIYFGFKTCASKAALITKTGFNWIDNLTKYLNNDQIPARINSICSKEFGSHEDLSIEFEKYLAGLQTNEEL